MESAKNREQSPKVNQQDNKSDSPTLSKTEAIKLLNESIDQLESTIKDISRNPAQNLPSSDSINTLLNTTQELADSVALPTPTSTSSPASVEETQIPPESTTPIPATLPIEIPSNPDSTPQSPKPAVKPDNKTVAKNQKKENRGLVIIVSIAVAIALVALVWLWLPLKQTTVPSISEPTVTQIGEPKPVIQPDTKTIENPIIISNNIPEPTVEDSTIGNTESSDSELESSEEISIPQELTSPGKVTNLKIATIEPELTFTPEQTLVAAVQTKLAELTSNYDPDLFNSIRVDLLNNSLFVEVTDGWYELNESRQNKIANEILERSRKFDFSKLQLLDPTGTLVARNPVVGDRAIIIQTSKNNLK